MECSNAIAWQTWRGEELIEEHFFYDPAMMKNSRPVSAAG
jgi:hypothetical protein